ncbi:MAG: transcriptional regulator [Aquincola tertiaricarbonis]
MQSLGDAVGRDGAAEVEAGSPADALSLCLLGPLTLRRGPRPMPLPASRKARALLAYLAMSPRPVARDALCRLLWQLPTDPRGELRWCLSKLRGVVDQPGHPRLLATDGGVRLALHAHEVDVLRIERALRPADASPAPRPPPDADLLRGLLGAFQGEFLEGLALQNSPPFDAWLQGQRRRLRALQAGLLQALVDLLPRQADERIELLGRWLQLAPLDLAAHERLLQALAAQGRWPEAQQHLQAAMQQFAAQRVDAMALSQAWQQVRLGAASSPRPAAVVQGAPAGRASIAVMPFTELQAGGDGRSPLGAWLAHDVTTRLAKLRTVFVIAQASAAALAGQGLAAGAAAQALNVGYVASGSLHRDRQALRLDVQLAEAAGARIVWADVFSAPLGDLLDVLEQLGDRLVNALASQVEIAERARAVLLPPSELDAWQSYHRGLGLMYRFDAADNRQAQGFFQAALRRDPHFARAHAGLSFTHFQDAFLGWQPRALAVQQAWRAAMQAVEADEQDPAARWALGRAHWLRGQVPQAPCELETALQLSPSFAQGHYTRAFILAQSGDALQAIAASDHARALSPYDPLVFAMLAARALALVRLGRHEEAADSALKAAARPHAHVHILAIAALCLALAGRWPQARAVVDSLQPRSPGYRLADLLAAFQLSEEASALLSSVAPRVGL